MPKCPAPAWVQRHDTSAPPGQSGSGGRLGGPGQRAAAASPPPMAGWRATPTPLESTCPRSGALSLPRRLCFKPSGATGTVRRYNPLPAAGIPRVPIEMVLWCVGLNDMGAFDAGPVLPSAKWSDCHSARKQHIRRLCFPLLAALREAHALHAALHAQGGGEIVHVRGWHDPHALHGLHALAAALHMQAGDEVVYLGSVTAHTLCMASMHCLLPYTCRREMRWCTWGVVWPTRSA